LLSPVRPHNRLLAALPPDDYHRLLPHLTTIPLRSRQVLRKRDESVTKVFFPNGGVCSIVGFVANGAAAECTTVGDEGVVGIEVFLSDENVTAFGETIVQVPGADASVLSVSEFRRELARHGALERFLGRYTEGVIAQSMQQTVCNTLHDVTQRCARWLLGTHDRMRQEDFYLSHDLLALMLGVRRPTVSAVAATLQKAGVIRYIHGHVAVLNRQRLEDTSCECYRIIRSLMWSPPPQNNS
jgi:hypothetical protein